MRSLTDEALRIPILDWTQKGRILEGRSKNDLSRGGKGNDTLYVHAGDDILFGETGDDTLYGGLANDFLSGGVGKNFLYGDAGDVFMAFRPGTDAVASGGEAIDTVKLIADFFAEDSNQVSHLHALVLPASGRNRVYADFSRQSEEEGRHADISLGALIRGLDMLENNMA